jgi:hypothetical protein
MRCNAWSSLATSACSALGLASLLALALVSPAPAHVELMPGFVSAGASETVRLVGHNDRRVPMTGLTVSVPAGFGVEGVLEADGWDASVEGATATWSGGELAPDADATFGFVVEAPAEPGAVELDVMQIYPDGQVVAFPAALTVVPGDESSGGDPWMYAIVVAGLLLALVGVVLAWRRRGGMPPA